MPVFKKKAPNKTDLKTVINSTKQSVPARALVTNFAVLWLSTADQQSTLWTYEYFKWQRGYLM